MLVFTGTHINKVDKKGRVSVPAPFRAALFKAGFSEISIFPSYNSKAIEGYGPDLIETMANDTFATYNPFGAQHDNLATQIFELMRQLEWDAEGRIGLPEDLMAHAGIAEQAAFVGKGRFFQIWTPDALAAQRSADTSKIAQDPPRLPLRRPEGT
jgi:MraZ protein